MSAPTTLSPVSKSSSVAVPDVALLPVVPQVRRWLQRLDALPDVRRARVERIRRELARGTYETQERLELAFRALLAEEIVY